MGYYFIPHRDYPNLYKYLTREMWPNSNYPLSRINIKHHNSRLSQLEIKMTSSSQVKAICFILRVV